MATSEQLNELAAALVAAQADFPTVAKDATNPFFKSKYADLASVIKTASPVLSKHGLAVSQFVGRDESNNSLLTTYLMHTSGQFISESMPLLLSKTDAQGQGSAITYARRYSYMSVLGLVADEDDDGNAASKSAAPKQTYSAALPLVPGSDGITAALQPARPGLTNPKSMDALKAMMARKGLTGTKAVEFAQFIVGKDKPESESEVQTLIASLEAK